MSEAVDKSTTYARIERLLDAARRAAKGDWRLECKLDEITVYPHYSEPGYGWGKEVLAVVAGDWNDTEGSTVLSRLAAALEELGCEVEWCDEWTGCGNCNGAVRIQPDSYGWTSCLSPESDDGEPGLCPNCITDEDYVELSVNTPSRALTRDIDLILLGFEEVTPNLEHGFYGQEDDPKAIYKTQRKFYDELVFKIDSQGQFATNFSLWGRNTAE